MKTEMVATKEIIPYARNPRKNEDAIAKVSASLKEYGWQQPIVVDAEMVIIAGHTRLEAAKRLKMEKVPIHIADKLTEAQVKAFRIADNRVSQEAEWDMDLLKIELGDLEGLDFDLSLTGFDDDELNALMLEAVEEGLTDDDEVPEAPENPVSVLGDVWTLGNHRLMCGDSTSVDDVEKLVGEEKAELLHADPPYGMGKQKDGVLNDNIYKDELDAFQMDWLVTFRTFLTDNASAYIWGNAPDLWRLFYKGGLCDSEPLELRNEIVWDKKSISGMKSPLLTQYPEASERCLYYQYGEQFVENVNAADFPEEWQPILDYLQGEAKSCGLNAKGFKELIGSHMFGHWFTTSQFSLISKDKYEILQINFPKNFKRQWGDLKSEWDKVKGVPKENLNRSYFDNAHDIMRDVWEFPRVHGSERHGHATPKPVEMMERVMRSSLPKGGLCLEPFGGSGATLIGAEKTSRRCYTMELAEAYVDIIICRWQGFTGKEATHEETGKTYNEMKAERDGSK